jgi:hypothetical protein
MTMLLAPVKRKQQADGDGSAPAADGADEAPAAEAS